ncbi:MAG: 3-deoxy-D-manno-octulosonic acid transferase [Campylobacteraceae bacterium]|jgi:3-deoxy-D-manno-octulosonic-acid transferase|nr:3-deoxy-D-manno-octulosonic acid transferase [Campylobacteraceae bacterium]MBT4030292.1 3-deoxy-D-manno-octulosonic acid transferase [Campylobacteraceae bacterium]MBT4179634.1 3-deoxy-D-manno-octulosonic acid transferase [Campylobacteraceae bacterium]MBT4572975.1 3-deoxy-D-manno-octulosonic acid transferase [Campylobacteraceae bacterium]MBT5323351.1 3-deoxy-D-manno-octulosonic acid transferase [Campylobacteraceae bacterium]
MIFSIVYYLISVFLYIIAIPYLIYKSTKSKYKEAIPARFFLKNNPKFDTNGIWFHSCSMGETKSLKPIIDELENNNIGPINISTNTNTGFEAAKQLTSNARYLPFELFLPFWINKQKVLVVMEAELWYMMFLYAKINHTKTILINARISDKSYNSYKKYQWFYSKIFKNIDKVFAQTDIDKKRLIELGAMNVETIGNIKLSHLPKITKSIQKLDDKFITTLASSHKNEEQLILNGYYKEMGRLIIVPRHPERFDLVDSLIKEYVKDKDISYSRYTQNDSLNTDIILIDTMGELINIFAISDAVILGGAFEKIGGHNPIEPAYFNCALISGEHIFNQKALFECVKNYRIIKNEEILDIMQNIKDIPKASLIKAGTIDPIIKEIKRK